MPYNTRRKSLSLPSLGIHLPVTHASRAAARASPPSTMPSSASPPAKKLKRSHELGPATPVTSTASATPTPVPSSRRDHALKYENTPPPSPEAQPDLDESDADLKPKEIDLEGINDEIVEAVIIQLQKTGNRPHLVKELAAILSQSVRIVETSANPAAIISSRLSTYLKRSWTALAPCPLAKELETVHPRRTYFYLTTYPHQPIPDPASHAHASFPQRTIISPSLSSADEAEADAERRREISPSPEVDLSSPEFENDDMPMPPTPSGSYTGRVDRIVRNHRAASPPLEKDEREFTQTARGMQKRKLTGDSETTGVPSLEMEDQQARNFLEPDMLFGEGRPGAAVIAGSVFLSSPAMKPSPSMNTLKRSLEEPTDLWSRLDAATEWDMRDPEHIELDELDCMLDDF
ncbi:hypothetical protein F5884DRAFT_677178 [Xylogone sp. PMI_703]|nr:hypothetical protein F5884DRAFT_677178 [Xylogone sp. PMI_703]